MNWLAHIFLSQSNIDYQLGNLLADPCKGRAFNGASDDFKQGMKMHLFIDTFTDQHPDFLMSKSRLNKKGHLKGVVIDLTYDLVLTQNWQQYANSNLNDFLDTFYAQGMQAIKTYPPELKTFVEKLIKSDHLRNYKNFNDLAHTFSRVDKRLSQKVLKKEATVDYLHMVEQNIEAISEDFQCFFPELLSSVSARLDKQPLQHWHMV